MQARFGDFDGRPIVLSISSIPLFLSLGRVVRASHRAASARKKIPAALRTTINSINSINSTVGKLFRSGRLFSHFGTLGAF